MATTPELQRWFDWLLLGIAVVAVGVADVFLKRAAAPGDLGLATRSPWFWGAIGLYLLQVVIFSYAFVTGWRLSLIGALQTALYGLIVLGAGIIFYREVLTPAQAVGALLAIGGVIMINWR